MPYWPYEKYKLYLQKFEQLFPFCRLYMADNKQFNFDCNNRNRISIRCPSQNNFEMNVCYTLHSIMGMPDAVPQQVLSAGTNGILMDPMVREYDPRIDRESIEVAFHNPRTIHSPYEYGFKLYTSMKNVFHLKKTVKNLLPPPYETNCHDYLADWKARGGWGPTSEKECLEECKMKESMKAWGCISGAVDFAPSNAPRCRKISGNGHNYTALASVFMECAKKNCKPACYQETYQVTKDAEDVKERNLECSRRRNRRDPMIRMEIRFDGMETTTYNYRPKYQIIETFSYIGGYVGMWLGISLVAVFDFLETVFLIMRYPFRRYVAYKNKQRRIAHIRNLRRDM